MTVTTNPTAENLEGKQAASIPCSSSYSKAESGSRHVFSLLKVESCSLGTDAHHKAQSWRLAKANRVEVLQPLGKGITLALH